MSDGGYIDPEDAEEIGIKVIEMADRCKSMNSVVPGAAAEWHFEMDDMRYSVKVTVAESR